MTSRWFEALAVLAIACLSFFIFPGHTILQSDTQIYIPILERFLDPSLLAKDEMAIRPHVSFTFYDEITLLLRRITGLSFETVLLGQQFLYRGIYISGLYLFVSATGLPSLMAWLVTALASLGAAVIGPAVLTVEYEPVPRGFALPFILFSLAMVARQRWHWAAAAATVAFGFHPPTALAYCSLLLAILVWRRQPRALVVLFVSPILMLSALVIQPSVPDQLPLFGRVDPEMEALQRMRASYNWVSVWAQRWMYLYACLSAALVFAWIRLRRDFSKETNIIILGLGSIGLLSVPFSYLFLEHFKLLLISQFQPGRYLLYITFFAILLSSIAAIRACQRGSYLESVLFFLVPLAMAATEWDTAKLLNIRLAVVCALAILCALASNIWLRRKNTGAFALVVIAAILPFLALPSAGVTNYAALHSEELNALAKWAATDTQKDAVFQFADVERRLEPGVFRARAERALYVDWKSGGQVNFLREFAKLWQDRWETLGKQQPIEVYRKLGIDYVVFRSSNRQPGQHPVYENAAWVVYDLKNSSTSLRRGIEACAPARVTEIAAAAFANRSAASRD